MQASEGRLKNLRYVAAVECSWLQLASVGDREGGGKRVGLGIDEKGGKREGQVIVWRPHMAAVGLRSLGEGQLACITHSPTHLNSEDVMPAWNQVLQGGRKYHKIRDLRHKHHLI